MYLLVPPVVAPEEISNSVAGVVVLIPTFSLLSIVMAVLVALSSIPVDVKSVIVAPDAMLTASPLAPKVNVKFLIEVLLHRLQVCSFISLTH
jgi:hypothetical protein